MPTISGLTDTLIVDKHLEDFNLESENIPTHVAIIMDGNGRWAKKRHLPRIMGHKSGTEAFRVAVKNCSRFGIKYLSVYAFSSENWKRPEDEVKFLMSLFKQLSINEVKNLNKNGARVKVLGDKEGLSEDLRKHMKSLEKQTEHNDVIQVNLLINYGSRREILDAIKTISKTLSKEEINDLTEKDVSNYLYTKDIPDPDLFIRTSGEYRISNFLLWQLSYAEFVFTDIFWPDFNLDELGKILQEYQSRHRRYGGL
ncbi:isoprenyl transferase [Candidatus Marinamargulisbacteria bacterium SCGC AAA071-K20]|nr:isoprenyl transferase [Candidatus Marinamargulisbacteria bacterium SCGC AAA071-K20]